MSFLTRARWLWLQIVTSMVLMSAVAVADPTITLRETDTIPPLRSIKERSSGSATKYNYGVNRSDCDNDLTYTYTASFASWTTTGYNFEVWAGTVDCKDTANRGIGGSAQRCWQVVSASGDARTGSQSITVRARDVVAHLGESSIAAGTLYSTASSDVCSSTSGKDAIEVTLYFMIVKTSDSASAAAASVPLYVDLVGPTAPEITDIGIKDGVLQVNWSTTTTTSDSGGTSVNPDVLKYKVWFTPKRGEPGTSGSTWDKTCANIAWTNDSTDASADADAGTGSDADVDATADADTGSGDAASDAVAVDASDAGSEAAVILPDTTSGLDYVDDISATSSSVDVTGLTNDVVYTFVLSAVDKMENVGASSSAKCTYPSDTLGFYETYRGAGGQAGGGFCSTGYGAGSGVMACGIGLAAIVAWRRRRRS